MSQKIAQIIVFDPAAFDKSVFDYQAREDLRVGDLVRVPFWKRQIWGVVRGFKEGSEFRAREILERRVGMPASLVAALRVGAEYFLESEGRLLKAALPRMIREGRFPEINEKWVRLREMDFEMRGVKQKEILQILRKGERRLSDLRKQFAKGVLDNLEGKGVIEIEERELGREEIPEPIFPKLTSDQEQALHKIEVSENPILLRGVTGSGKTEVYVRAVWEEIKRGKSALILVPEIALTPQLLFRFEKYFGSEVGVWHSNLAEGVRAQTWQECASGLRKVMIGSRSAVWVPRPDLGIVIVDEYHDSSLRQEVRPFYDARKIAEILTQEMGAKLVFGSATPRVEDYFLVKK